jgi:hypothetical protein
MLGYDSNTGVLKGGFSVRAQFYDCRKKALAFGRKSGYKILFPVILMVPKSPSGAYEPMGGNQLF